MSLCNTYIKQTVLALLAYSVLVMYTLASSQSVLAATLNLDIKPVATLPSADKAIPALCVQVNLAPCAPYNPLPLEKPELFSSISGSPIQIQGLYWAMATVSNMYLVPTNMMPAPYSCAGVSALAASAVLTVSVQIEGDAEFLANMQLPVKLETGKTYNVCASGIGPDKRALNNKKTMLLFQIKTLNNTVISQSHRSTNQSDATPLSLLSTIALLLAVIAIVLYISVSRQLNTNTQGVFPTVRTSKSTGVGSKTEKQSEERLKDK